ncbi:MAG: APC family permease [Myxococcota bacterium]|nr:APC family permease [Myxococcota bacterium]
MSTDRPRLARRIGPLGLVLYGLGTMIGAGVYALTGVVAGRAGMAAPLAFVLAAALAGFSALSFAELSGRLPRAGGEAVYVREATGLRWLGTTVGLLMVLAGTTSMAAITTAFAGYLSAFVAIPAPVATATALSVITALAVWGVSESVKAAGAMTLIEVGGLLLVVAFALGSGALFAGHAPGADAAPLAPEVPGLAGILGAALVAFYAFLGFEDMVNVAEEVRDVRRVLPRAILWTLVIGTAIYVAISIVAVRVVAPGELARSEAPLALVFERSGGDGRLLGGVAIIAMLNGVLVQGVKAARVLYGLATTGQLPAALGSVNPRTRTPILATVLCGGMAIGLAWMGELASLAEAASVVTLVTFSLANLSLLLLKRRGPAPPEVPTFPVWVPLLGLVSSLGLVSARLLGWVA